MVEIERTVHGVKQIRSGMDREEQVKILIVDDNQANLFSLEVILSNPHYEFVKASSGKDALRILLKEHDFCLILIDVNMPVMDGFETTELIRQNEKLKLIPIIFLTAYFGTPDHIFRGYQAGAVDYMLKPLMPEILRAKVAIFVDLYRKNKELIVQRKKLVKLNQSLKKQSEGLIQINQELEKFASVASHDLQEPLRTINSFIQLLDKKLHKSLDAESKELMDFVVNACQRMQGIITGLLDYARIGSKQEEFDLVESSIVMRDVQENLKESIRASEARIEIGPLPRVRGVHTLLVQLYQNLISNSIKFRKAQAPVIRIACVSNEDEDVFSVSDNGIGMEQKYEQKIFEMFERLSGNGEFKGTGIGLAICKKIVELHEGKIWMTSEPGKGSTFYFSLKKASRLRQAETA
jgi:signal transduction histidine kinase